MSRSLVAKRETRAEKERKRTEARVGLASNALGLAAGTAALATAAQNPALKDPKPENAGPVTRRVAEKLKMKPRTAARLFRAGAIGATALQAANLGGDIVANRVLSREANKKIKGKKPVEKSIEQSVISKSDEVKVTGHGVNVAKMSTRTKAGIVAGVVGGGAAAGGLKVQRDHKEKKRLEEENARLKGVAKRYFDAEADRQRRLGLYAGLGLTGATAAGAYAGKDVKLERTETKTNGKTTRKGLKITAPAGSGKKKLVAAGLAAGSGLAGLAAYKHGVSERNRSWT